jgi:hypothetical protein
MTTRSARIVVFTGLVAVASPARVTAQASQACSVTAGTPRRVELADGRIVSVDVQSMAQSGGSILAIGRHAYVFPRTTTSVTSPVIRDSIIGFEIEQDGGISLVPAPLASRPVFFPKVAAGQDGFHIVFATSGDGTASQTGKQDSATIWYARYVNRRWTTPERVVSVRRSYLQPELTSELLESAGTLSWAFVFADTWENESSGGVVLLRRQRGAWSADTLRTPTTPGVVRLVHGASGDSVVAVFTREYQRGTTSILAQLYLATFTSRWSEASLIAGDGRRALTLPVLSRLGDGILISWISWIPWQSETSRIEWLRIGRDGRFVDGPVIATGEKAYPFELIVMDDRHPIWLYHGVPFGTTVELASATDTSVIQLGNIGAPFGDPKPETVAIDDSRVLAHTMRQGSAPDDPMVASWMTTLEFRCPRSARR